MALIIYHSTLSITFWNMALSNIKYTLTFADNSTAVWGSKPHLCDTKIEHVTPIAELNQTVAPIPKITHLFSITHLYNMHLPEPVEDMQVQEFPASWFQAERSPLRWGLRLCWRWLYHWALEEWWCGQFPVPLPILPVCILLQLPSRSSDMYWNWANHHDIDSSLMHCWTYKYHSLTHIKKLEYNECNFFLDALL